MAKFLTNQLLRVLQIDGVPVGKDHAQYAYKNSIEGSVNGSCMMVMATDAPLDARNLKLPGEKSNHGIGKDGWHRFQWKW